MLRNIALVTGFFLFSFLPAAAQFYPTQYRPAGLDWQQFSTDHFRIVFPKGEEQAARQTAAILEEEYSGVHQLVGGGLSDFPVILRNYNDRSNGFVTPLHFRTEIDIPPIAGNTMNPVTGGWLQNVAPHELVHAMQFSNRGGIGLAQLITPFSPDLARALHGAAPSGVLEGLAVYYESASVAPGGGRGNYPFFMNPFHAVFNSNDRWSMGQMVQIPTDTRPFNRFYIGGYAFTDWLQRTYGSGMLQAAVEFHVQWPFLGYGMALRHATGLWPAELYNRFEEDMEQRDQPAETNMEAVLPLPRSGPDVRRPLWLNDSTLVFYASYYDASAGLYRYDIPTGAQEQLLETGLTSDYRFDFSADTSSIFFSYYKPDPRYPDAFNASMQALSLTEATTRAIAPDHRLYAPSTGAYSHRYAIETAHTYGQLVRINAQGEETVEVLYADAGSQLVAVAAHPRRDSLAVVMNRGGVQGLWLTSTDAIEATLDGPPAIAFPNGSVFDPAWHPAGDRLLFSADFSGTLQVYEYDSRSGTINRWTDALYNAFEATYSPDGDKISYIIQQENLRYPAIRSRADGVMEPVPRRAAVPAPIAEEANETIIGGPITAYHTGFSWLKPRTILPVFEEISRSNEFQIGAGLHSSDLLQQQAYSLELTTAKERLWYDLTYQNRQFFPGFQLRFFNQPSFRSFLFNADTDPTVERFLRQEQSASLSIPINLTLEQNVDLSSVYLEPRIRYARIRYLNDTGGSASDAVTSAVGGLYGQFNYKLQQNIRDVQPRSGIQLYSQVEQYLGSSSLVLNTTGSSRTLQFARPTGLRAGISGFVTPAPRWNQTLRLRLEGITQTHPVFDNQSVVSNGFSEPVFPVASNLLSFNARYTIPLLFPDDGGLLLPLYLSNIYLVGFSNTISDPSAGALIPSSRSVLGAGVRARFRISNLPLDIGFGIAMEPSRGNFHYFIGDF